MITVFSPVSIFLAVLKRCVILGSILLLDRYANFLHKAVLHKRIKGGFTRGLLTPVAHVGSLAGIL